MEKCRQEKVDGVLNFCIDPAQKPYQQICEKLGLPCIGTKETFDILTDKRKFKDYCTAHNVDVIPEYTYKDITADKAEYPLFIKPTDSRGSRGQSVCHNKEEALKAIEFAQSESSDGGFLCEKHMVGHRDLATAFFVVDSKPYLIKFGNRHLGRKEDNLDKQVICTELPSEFSKRFEKNVLLRVEKMIESLGIKYGPVFMQGFIDGDTVRYYDPAQRMPGGDYDLVLETVTGFSTVKSLIHFALTGDIDYCVGNPQNAYNLEDGIALLISISVTPGLMKRVEGLDELQKDERVIYTRQIIPEGSVIPDSGDVRQRIVAIGAYIKNREEEKELVEKVYSVYKVLDQDNNDMIISKFDIDSVGRYE